MKPVVVRAISGTVYVALIVGAILAGSPYFDALMALIAVSAIIELSRLVCPNSDANWAALAAKLLDVVMTVCLVLAPMMMSLFNFSAVVQMFVILSYSLIRFTLALYDKGATAFNSAAWSIFGIIYVALPLTLLGLVYNSHGNTTQMLVLCTFIMIWLNDTGAYCVGSLIGRRRLFERLSPKKSWEGFFGGLAFCLLAGLLFYKVVKVIDLSLGAWLCWGAIVCVLSTWGDLFESLMKRTEHVKDSGHIIPGHGGVLDRIDSLLFVGVGFYLFNLIML